MVINKQLIDGCVAGNEKSLSQFYHICYPELMSVCIRYQRNKSDAESLLNEGFIKIISNLSKFDNSRPYIPWMRRIMININIDHFRKHKTYTKNVMLVESMENDTDEAFTLNEADLDLDADSLLDMIRALPPMAQKVFNLYALDGFKHAEIATLLNINAGTSKYHLSTARARLQKMINDATCSSQIRYSDEKIG